jgi:histidyl-tRNA synthetase
VERILLAMPSGAPEPHALCSIAPIGRVAAAEALVLARELRAAGVRVDLDGRGDAGKSLKAMLRRADALGARVCLVLGEAEVGSGTVQLKDLGAHAQSSCARAEVVAKVRQLMATPHRTGGGD